MKKPVTLQAPTATDCEVVRGWRNEVLPYLRTPYRLTREQQERFYVNTVCNPASLHRYLSAYRDGELVAFGGLTYIEWENGSAEISLMTHPECRGVGVGHATVDALLHEAFDAMRLQTVFGECYDFNPATGFWRHMLEYYEGDSVIVPRRKFFGGRLHDSMLFWFIP